MQDKSPLGYTYTTETIAPKKVSLVPILRSGLSMIDALTSLLPNPVPIHHLGMYRSKPTFEPIEYYNNLPYHRTSTTDSTDSAGPSELAIVVDPVIATGATATAAVETLKDWGVKRVLVLCILGSVDGVKRVAESWEGCVEVWCGGCDEGTDERGMIKPGLGDVGDRLYLTIGK
jgi:uracil phosphoribosyltransferase